MQTRGRRWLAVPLVVLLVVGLAAVAVAQLPPGGTFADDNGNIHEPNIEAIAAASYTAGCNPPANDRYCPSQPVTRAEMAAFVLRLLGESGNLPTYQDYFTDVPAGQWYTGYVERLYELGMTTGYGDGRYGPNNTVTRAEMAAFLLRVKAESPGAVFNGYFTDVSTGAWYTGYVERLYEMGITSGCSTAPLAYCPNAPVLRDQMATFLARTAGLDPIVPPPPVTTSTTSSTTSTSISTTTTHGGGDLAENWFLVTYGVGDYACYDDPYGFHFQQYECWRYFGSTPVLLISPDLYCSGSYLLQCDPSWYPDELDDYTLISYSYQDYICDNSFSTYSTYGDLDCVRYSGGAPPYSFWPDLMCSPDWGLYDCNQAYYPSEMDGRFFADIGWSTNVCEDTWQGSECWGPYYSGHPSAVVIGLPDYYCNYLGCDPYGYP